MKRSLLTLAFLLGTVPSAVAAPFGEVPFYPAGGPATCLRATGYPGELVRSTPTGAQFLQAGAGGLTRVADVTRGAPTSSCPEAAARPNGAGLVAFATYSETGSESSVRAALREPGGAWGAAVDIAALPRFVYGHPLAADVSERGDALVAYAAASENGPTAVRAVRRAPGAPFGAAETIFTAGKRATSETRVAAGVSVSGESVVAWSFQPRTGAPREVWAAVAAPGGAFAAPTKLGALQQGAAFSLAVGAGGHAVVAFPSGHNLLVAERGPGAGFGRPTRVGEATDRIAVYATAAVRPDGGAIVAWDNALSGDLRGVTRTQPGPFGAPTTLAPKSGLRYPKRVLDLFSAFTNADSGEITSDSVSPDRDGSFPRALIAPDGRAVVTDVGIGQRDGVWTATPRVVTVPLAGGAPEAQGEGAGLRDPGVIAPFVLATGTVGIAWADNDERGKGGRVHAALEGVADRPEPTAPEVHVGGPVHRVLKADEPLRLTVRCSAACDVRVQLEAGALAPTANVELTRAGAKRLELDAFVKPLASLKGGPVKLLVRSGAPGAGRPMEQSRTLQLRRLPDAPRPRVLDAVARRDGKSIVLTWRTDRDATAKNFSAYATKTREDPTEALATLGGVAGDADIKRDGRRFSARIEGAAGARYVKIVATVKGARKVDTTTVRVRG